MRPVGQVEHGADPRTAVLALGAPHARQPCLVAEGLVQALAEGDGHIFGTVMVVDVTVAFAVDNHLDASGTRELGENAIEHCDSRRYSGRVPHRGVELRRGHHFPSPSASAAFGCISIEPRRVQVDAHLDGRLLGGAPPLGRARLARLHGRRGRPGRG